MILQRLAFEMMQGKQPVDFRRVIPRVEAEKVIVKLIEAKPNEFKADCPVQDYLDDLLNHHLIQPASNSNQIEFRHQLIQEYYAAEALLEQLPDLSDKQLTQEYLNYTKWTEPLALMLALADDQAQALDVVQLAMEEVDLILGARLAGEVSPTF
jgi:predicted NACHT family NTPase